MDYNKTRIIFVLFFVLAVFYFANILLTQSVYDALIDKPVKISFMILEPPKEGCENCFEANKIIQRIDSSHNIKYKSESISYDNALSQKYIETYDIKNLPAIIISGNIENKKITSAWNALFGEKRNERIIIENLLPYYDLKSGRVKGVISATLIKDATCENCFDENTYINILRGQFGVFISDTTVYDIASKDGKALVQKYAISKVPTLILSPETKEYSSLVSSWTEVGTIEKDGWFIFREVQKLNLNYKDI